MSRRVFIAIPISRNLQMTVHQWQSRYKKIPVRWIEGKNLHVTLVPPWAEDNIPKITKTLKHFVQDHPLSSFTLSFTNISFGPNPRSPRLIWAQGSSPKEITLLKQELEQTLNRQPELRSFHLHLTLARFRQEHFSSFPIKSLNEQVSWKQTFDSIVLMESHLSSRGADYEILTEISL